MANLDRSAFRARRDALGLTLKDVGERANVHFTTVHKLENGTGGMEFDTITSVMAVLGLTFQDIGVLPELLGQPEQMEVSA